MILAKSGSPRRGVRRRFGEGQVRTEYKAKINRLGHRTGFGEGQATGRDHLALGPIRKPALLRQDFGVCVAAPAQVVSLQKIQGHLVERGALETIAHYLPLLEEAFLVTALPKHARRALRRRAAPPKLVVLNQALLAATDPAGAPEPARDPARFGA